MDKIARIRQLEGIDNPRLRGRKQSDNRHRCLGVKKELIIPDSGDGNPELELLRDFSKKKELIIPDSGDGNITEFGVWTPFYEGIDNPRLRGRKLIQKLTPCRVSTKELIIPDSGDGNSSPLSWSVSQSEGIDNPRLRGRKLLNKKGRHNAGPKELIIPDSGDGNSSAVRSRPDLYRRN